ncbi:MAG: TonB-dependent receptor [Ignavibacteria bacterium]|nr:TonB-dependent receptor [Ignavibacteria bacterium]
MTQRYCLVFLLLLFPSSMAIAQSGKVSGRVIDRETGEPLIGASVSILGTTLGAATDVDGRYNILQITPGTYDVKTSFVGYQDVTISGIRVAAGLTQDVDFSLPGEDIEVEPIIIIAQRPLIEKSATNVKRIIRAEDFEDLPVRGTSAYISLVPGVVQQYGEFYIRGSRSDEVGYLVEGANTRNIHGAGNLVTTIPEAVEEILVETGGYAAEFGGATAGIIQQNLKTGGSNYSAFVQYETDDFGNYPHDEFLGNFSYGYRNAVLGLSGPLVADNIKFNIVGENSFIRDYEQIFWTGANFGFLEDTGFFSGLAGDTSVAPVRWEDGNVPARFDNRYTVNGTVSFDYNPLLVRFASSYTSSRRLINDLPIRNLFNAARLPYDDNTSFFGNIKGTYFIDPLKFVEVNVNYLTSSRELYDPNFGDDQSFSDLLLYADSAKGAEFGWQFVGPSEPPNRYLFFGFPFNRPGALVTGYERNKRSYIGGSASFTGQWGRHEVKAGTGYERWTMRLYSIGGLAGLLSTLRTQPNLAFGSDLLARVIRNASNINNYGYDEFLRELDSGPDGPKHPWFLSFYLQDKIEFDDLVINAGLRLDRMFMDSWRILDPSNPVFNPDDQQLLGIVEGTTWTFLQPRLGLSFPVTDRTVFHLQYGKFVQAPELNRVLQGRQSAYDEQGFNSPIGNDLAPVRTTQYEIGFTQQISEFTSFDITGFYKNIKGQIQQEVQETVAGSPLSPYFVYVNSDFTTTFGAELQLRIRRTNRVQAQVNYTLSSAKGINNFPRSSAGAIQLGDEAPSLVSPLRYDQRHRGSVWLDYRFAQGDGGPILQGMGLNLLFSFNSGRHFTLSGGGLGQQRADGGGILNDGDPRNRVPLEPINSSTTPGVGTLDLRLDKTFVISSYALNIYVKVLNVFDAKSVIDVYLRTGNAFDDGYLTNPELSEQNIEANGGQRYIDLYRAINLENRQHQRERNGNDLFGSPRQIILGARFEI